MQLKITGMLSELKMVPFWLENYLNSKGSLVILNENLLSGVNIPLGTKSNDEEKLKNLPSTVT
jgi:hypothetical protein